MTRFKLLGATALVLSAALASPVMAKDAPRDHVKKEARMTPKHMNQHRHMAARGDTMGRDTMMGRDNMTRRNDDMAFRDDDDRGGAYRSDNGWNNNGWNNSGDWAWNDNRRDSAFGPGDVAAGVVGGAVATADAAVNTAGAIATAPFRGDSYAYYNDGYKNNGWNGYNNGWNGQSYAQRNGFVCQPGTWFRGDDGRRHICQ